jgi:hypothetical protein
MKTHLAETNKDKVNWKHGFGTKPNSPASFELYGGFAAIGTAYTISIMRDNSLLAIHQNGSKVVIAPSATYFAAVQLSCSISDYWRTGKNNIQRSK